MLAVPGGGRAIGERNNGFFDNGNKKGKEGKVSGGELFGGIVGIGILRGGLDELRLGRGVDHQGLNGFNIKERFGG